MFVVTVVGGVGVSVSVDVDRMENGSVSGGDDGDGTPEAPGDARLPEDGPARFAAQAATSVVALATLTRLPRLAARFALKPRALQCLRRRGSSTAPAPSIPSLLL